MANPDPRDLHYVFAHNWAAPYRTFGEAAKVASELRPCVVVSWEWSPVWAHGVNQHGYRQTRKVEYK